MSRNPGAFRSRTNGSGGYTNGYSDGGYGQYGATDNDYTSQGRQSNERRRDRRQGGYGGFAAPEREEEAPPVNRPSSIERRRANRRSGDKTYGDSSRSRSRPGARSFGPGSRQMEGPLYRARGGELTLTMARDPRLYQTGLGLHDGGKMCTHSNRIETVRYKLIRTRESVWRVSADTPGPSAGTQGHC